MFVKKRMGLGALVALAAVLAMALTASSALATEVLPASTTITATNSGTTNFLPENAFSALKVECKKSTAVFKTPEVGTLKLNQNKTSVGTNSTGSGAVTMAISEKSFTECATNTGVAATVTTAGNWGIAANSVGTTGGTLDIATPEGAATIALAGELKCSIVVSKGQASVVTGNYTNSTKTNAFDAQLKGEGCGLPPISQFEAKYTLNNSFEIKP
jgi:hypothetical protein